MSVSTIQATLTKHDIFAELDARNIVTLREALAQVPDPRKKRGIRHAFLDLLVICAAAVISGAQTLTTIHEWAVNAKPFLTARNIRVPSLATVQRIITIIDGELLDSAISSWTRKHTAHHTSAITHVISLDGKTVRGSATNERPATMLLAGIDQRTNTVVAQVRIAEKSNEIPHLQPLLDEFVSLEGVVVTVDALNTQRSHARYLQKRGGWYVFTVKGNQPSLLSQVQTLNWKHAPVMEAVTEKSHGKIVTRTVRGLPAPTRVKFPGVAQVLQITRDRHSVTSSKRSTEIAYIITSVPSQQAGPTQIASWVRQHWHIENKLHWVRDVTFNEDRSQVRTGNGPHVMASFRNIAISVHRFAGEVNIAKALRHTNRHPSRGLAHLT